ncbi:MAG: hypothetical protein NVS3B20_10160 [Polyangiales bacterium]
MRFAFALVATGLAALSCSGSKSEPAATDFSKLALSTGEFDVPRGDSFECFYTDQVTPRELGVQGATGSQETGGHHLVIYYTDVSRPPQHHKCEDAEMVNWHQVAGVGGEPGNTDTVIGLPSGFAQKVPAGKQLVMQAHYINAGPPKKVTDHATLNMLEPSQVKQYANDIFHSNAEWTIPAKAPFEVSSTCRVGEDVQMLLILGHLHEQGKHFKLERLDDAGKTADVLYDHDWSPSYSSHPPIARWTPENPLLIKKGTRLRQTCTWNNATDQALTFPREMCVFFGYYFPDHGELNCQIER